MNTRCFALAAASLLAVVLSGSPAQAQAADRPAPETWISELRVGVLAHDQAPLVDNLETGTDLNVEVLFRSPSMLRGWGSPRPHVGMTLASQGTSLAYAGLTWEYELPANWFLTAGLGLAVHDGDPLLEKDQTEREQETEKALGCRVLFHFGIGGGYRISPHWNVALHYEHVSNADLCENNEGLENVGARVGWVF